MLNAPCITLTPDGSLILIGDLFRGILAFDVKSRRLIRTLSEFVNVKSIAVSPNGKFMAAGTWPGEVGIWTLPDFTPVARQRMAISFVFGLAFSPDNHILATGGSDQRIKLWTLPVASDPMVSGSLVPAGEFRGHEGGIHTISFAGGNLFSSSFDGTARMWPPTPTAGRMQEFRPPPKGWSTGDDVLGRSRDGSRLWWLHPGGELFAWEARKGGDPVAKTILPPDVPLLESRADVARFRLSVLWHEGELFYHATNSFVCRFDPETSQHARLFSLLGTNVFVYAMVTNDSVPFLITSMRGERPGGAWWGAWDLRTGKHATGPWAEFRAQASPEEDGFAITVCQSPDGRWVAQEEQNHTIALWDAISQKRGVRIQGSDYVYHMYFPPGNRLLVVGFKDGSAGVWDIRTGSRIGAAIGGALSGLFGVQLSRDGRTLIASSDDLTTRMYSVTSGQEMILIPDLPPDLRSGLEEGDAGILFSLNPTKDTRPAYLPIPSIAEIDAAIARAAP